MQPGREYAQYIAKTAITTSERGAQNGGNVPSLDARLPLAILILAFGTERGRSCDQLCDQKV